VQRLRAAFAREANGARRRERSGGAPPERPPGEFFYTRLWSNQCFALSQRAQMTDDETLAECCSWLDAGDPQSVAGALDKVSASCKLVLQARQCCKACKVSRSSLTLQALARRSDSSSTQRAVLARLTQGRRSRERHDVGFGAPRATLPCNVDALGH